MTILITGSAGFIGFNLAKRLIKEGKTVIGYDNINPYYSTYLKESRLKELEKEAAKTGNEYHFVKGDLEDINLLEQTFKKFNPKEVVNLAAQAGVRYSIENPSAYIQSNIVGFGNILECCRHHDIKNLIYASPTSLILLI